MLPSGVRLHWREAGNPAKPPIVWIHGGSVEDSSIMLPDLEPFFDRVRLLLPDTRGHGLSQKFERVEDYTYARKAEDRRLWLDALGVDAPVWGGASMGGALSLGAAVHAPARVRAVVSTSALELGIDIGALDASIMAGYPGTIAATWQRAGRAGRRAGRSAAVLVASSAPLDQFMVRHPDYFFGASPEHALVNPDNLQILLDHIKCAAFELPFHGDERFGQEDLQAVLGLLGEEGFVHQADGQWNWTHESYPADAVSLRSVSSDNVVVIDVTVDPQVIAETDFTSAPSMLHEKAIYILEGQLFHVERFDFDHRKAYVKRVDCDYYTDAIKYSKVTILDERSAPAAPAPDRAPIPGAHGEVHVVARVIGFKKIRFYTNENVGSGELDLPEQQMHTTSYWLTVPNDVLASLPYDSDAKRDGVSGMAQAMRTVAQLLLMCDRNDLGVSVNADGETAARRPPYFQSRRRRPFRQHHQLPMRQRPRRRRCHTALSRDRQRPSCRAPGKG